MYDYIEDNLSNIPTPMASQTLSAPAHNRFAEKILGLVDYHFRNAHNVKIETLPWLCSKPHNEQEKKLNFV